MTASSLRTVLTHHRLRVVLSLTALCVLAWLFLVHLALQMETMEGLAARMMGMTVDDGLSARLAVALGPVAAAQADAAVNFVLVALMWAVMMVGMMLPSAAPTILLFAALEQKRAATHPAPGRTALFVTGYLAIWSAFSVAAAALQTVLAHAGLVSMHLAATGTTFSGALFIAAGLYELTPLKDLCLRHCRSPLEWLPRHMKPGRIGALRMGLEHGAYCVGCCWVLMLLLFVGGVMNLIWVAALAAVVLVQKVLPGGAVSPRVVGAGLVVAGLGLLGWPLWAG